MTLLVLTRGEQGGLPAADASGMPALRETEQRAASARLGVRDVRFLEGYRDGWLEPTFELQREIVLDEGPLGGMFGIVPLNG